VERAGERRDDRIHLLGKEGRPSVKITLSVLRTIGWRFYEKGGRRKRGEGDKPAGGVQKGGGASKEKERGKLRLPRFFAKPRQQIVFDSSKRLLVTEGGNSWSPRIFPLFSD